ncbi:MULTISPECIES: Tet(A)/Tet(B)/Tet(C) family tetracycline efflux MFS transporter [Ralstonia]|jgi:DHA1 family tetracycline resistance protein-like MFS transporter|uniref:Tetracycline resistance protein, class C n=2 Tax=Pseudomonadota TaxID=1224 RepID=A0ABM9K3B9_9RALS|nr:MULTISPECIES: Tet(A)/Tet(B)/Tet(C) family tetracycline efflux MFS transporter [unclassified Ralstonia]CAJ0811036.1 Tetracycline resistance protein, class C [Ralstonia sp. LMG 18101]
MPAFAVILSTLALDAMGVGLIMPILPSLLRELDHTGDIAFEFGLLIAAYAAMQFLFAPILGALADRFGRRPVLLVSLAGAAIDYLVMALSPHAWVLYLGRVVAGITGANYAVGTAYIADITAPADRARRYGLMNACFGLGFIAGPALGGLLGDWWLRAPFLLAAVLNGVNFLIACVALPESRRTERAPFAWRTLLPVQSLRRMARVPTLLPFLIVLAIIEIVGQIPQTLWVIHGEARFGWDTRAAGLSLAAYGLMHALSQAFLTGPIARAVGERRAVVLSVMMDMAGFAAMAWISAGWMVYPTMVLLCMAEIGMPAMQAMLSRQVSEHEQGELQGALASMASVAAMIGPLAATAVYAATAQFWSGTVWLMGAVLNGVCLIVLMQRAARRAVEA